MGLDTILWLHGRIGNAVPLFMGLLGILNLINYFRRQGVDGGIIGAIVIGEIMMIVMAILGITLFIALGRVQNPTIHILYGSLSVIFLPGLWAYIRGATDRRASLIWGLSSFFLMGLTLRAISTAG